MKVQPDGNGQDNWITENLPERLRKFAQVMVSLECRAGTEDLKNAELGFDPSRIFHDYKKARWKRWITNHVGHEDTGVYVFYPGGKALNTVSKSSQKRFNKLSK